MRQLLAEDRAAFRLDRLLEQSHAGFVGIAASLANIAFQTGTNDVLPVCQSTPATRNDVIEAQLVSRKSVATVLAAIFVTQKDVPTVELNHVLGEVVVLQQADDPGNLDPKVHRLDPIGVIFAGLHR